MRRIRLGDTVKYSFVTRAGGLCEAIVEVLEFRMHEADDKPVAKVRFKESVSDHTGNGFFDYMARIGGSMWASCEYLALLDTEEKSK